MKLFSWHKCYTTGFEAGISTERKYLLGVLQARRNELLAVNALDTANVYQSAIKLIEETK
jgi:hypothetical protein